MSSRTRKSRGAIFAVLVAVLTVVFSMAGIIMPAGATDDTTPTVPVTSVVPDTSGNQPVVENTEDVKKDEPVPPVESTNEDSPETSVDDTQNDDKSTQASEPAPSKAEAPPQKSSDTASITEDPPPVDDNDGYPAESDACEGTLPGKEVDEHGCAIDGSQDNSNDDNDGRPYHDDNCPFQAGTDENNGCPYEEEPVDTDSDGDPDTTDPDDDGDGVNDPDDAFPLNKDEDTDTDGDGTGNNADPNDDGDEYSDDEEKQNDTDPLDPNDPGTQPSGKSEYNTDNCEFVTIEEPSGVKPEDSEYQYKLDGKNIGIGTYLTPPGQHVLTLQVSDVPVDSDTLTVKKCDEPVVNPTGFIEVWDCFGNGAAFLDNTLSTVPYVFGLRVNGEVTNHTVPAGEFQYVDFFDAEPGSTVELQNSEGEVFSSATVPDDCVEPGVGKLAVTKGCGYVRFKNLETGDTMTLYVGTYPVPDEEFLLNPGESAVFYTDKSSVDYQAFWTEHAPTELASIDVKQDCDEGESPNPQPGPKPPSDNDNGGPKSPKSWPTVTPTSSDTITAYADTGGGATSSKAATNPLVWVFGGVIFVVGFLNRRKLLKRR